MGRNAKMNNKQTKQNLPTILIVSILLGLIIWQFSRILVNRLPVTMPITNIFQPAVGGSCGHMLYDKNGDGYKTIKLESYANGASSQIYNFITTGYVGSAPLYDVKPESLGFQQPSVGCYDFPSKIDAVIAQNGISMYPVNFTAKNNSKSKWLRVGESYSLVVTANIGDYFPSNPNWIPVMPLVPNELIEVRFSLYAPNFEFSPTNQETQKIPLGLNIPAEQTWSIAPIDRAEGIQYLVAKIEGDNILAEGGLNLDIRNIFGVDSKLLSIIIPVGSVIAYLLTQAKNIIDLLQTNKKKNKPQKRKLKKR